MVFKDEARAWRAFACWINGLRFGWLNFGNARGFAGGGSAFIARSFEAIWSKSSFYILGTMGHAGFSEVSKFVSLPTSTDYRDDERSTDQKKYGVARWRNRRYLLGDWTETVCVIFSFCLRWDWIWSIDSSPLFFAREDDVIWEPELSNWFNNELCLNDRAISLLPDTRRLSFALSCFAGREDGSALSTLSSPFSFFFSFSSSPTAPCRSVRLFRKFLPKYSDAMPLISDGFLDTRYLCHGILSASLKHW